MHLELDWKLLYYKQELVQGFPRDEAAEKCILRPIAFTSKSLSSTEKRYHNIEREGLDVPYGLEKFHHYCFMREVGIITDHKLLVALFKSDVATI